MCLGRCPGALGVGAGVGWCCHPEAPSPGAEGSRDPGPHLESPEPSLPSLAFGLKAQALHWLSPHHLLALRQGLHAPPLVLTGHQGLSQGREMCSERSSNLPKATWWPQWRAA